MFATVDNLNNMNLGDTIVVADDRSDSYTRVPSGMYKGMFESHLYFGELYGASELAAQLEGVECEVLPAGPIKGSKMMNIIYSKDTATGWKDNSHEYPVTYLIPGLCRGFNIEYKRPDGSITYGSCIWTEGEPDMDDVDFKYSIDSAYMLSQCEPTGNVVFRGYGETYWDFEEREEFIRRISINEISEMVNKGLN